MSNDYFQFKQMRIHQDRCAMKVSTDACIQGAWTPLNSSVKQVLDIGTGTGLLSLMLAQQNNNLSIDALEIDEHAAAQAQENIDSTAFCKQINVKNVDAVNFCSDTKYDLIICNPPFFTKSLTGPDEKRNVARHNDSLSQQDLAKTISGNLAQDGYASILLPLTEFDLWQNHAKAKGLFTSKTLLIKPFEHSKPNRIIIICAKNECHDMGEETLVIYQAQKIYTDAFTELMRPYYLNL